MNFNESKLINDLTTYAEIVVVSGGLSPEAWKRVRRICTLLKVDFSEVCEAVEVAR